MFYVGRFTRNKKRLLTTAALATLVASCGDGGSGKLGISCFPDETQRWIWQASENEGDRNPAMSEPIKAETSTIYVDRSASMLGYLRGADNDNRPFQILAGNLPVVARTAGATKVQYRGFGVNISEPMTDAAATFQDPATYRCAGGSASCESKESHLDKVLAMVAEKPEELAIVISDLWYDNSMDSMGGPTALQEPLTRILQSGRAVAIYGIEAPFDGTIYDIPAGGTAETSVSHKGTHPLFLLAIGTKNDVLEFDLQLERSGARTIREGLASGAIKRSIFTVDPGPLKARKREPVAPGADPAFRQVPFETHPGIKIQQFQFDSSAIRRDAKLPVRSASWTAPVDDDFLENTVWQGEYSASVDLWRRDGDKCGKWSKISTLVNDTPFERGEEGAPGKFEYGFDSKSLAGQLKRSGVYMISGELSRVSVDTPNPANAWAEEWSFTSDQAGSVQADRQELFPTLNLTEMMRIMENALRTATERNGGGVIGFTVLVNSEG